MSPAVATECFSPFVFILPFVFVHFLRCIIIECNKIRDYRRTYAEQRQHRTTGSFAGAFVFVYRSRVFALTVSGCAIIKM